MTIDYQNGNQEAVLNAIKQGVSDPKAIATWLSLDLEQVRNAINRLKAAGLVRRMNLGGYAPVVKRLALEDTWR